MIKDSFYEELEQVFYGFPEHHMKILSGDFNAKGRQENIFSRQFRMRVYIRLAMIMLLK